VGHNDFFPTHITLGLDALKNIFTSVPTSKFCPKGGISFKNYLEFLSLENVISLGDSWLQKDFKNLNY
tara:strand:+ start:1173 stop:1376 length:204 start_codon:yes stop_codon:yes gene_type:complete